MVKLKGTNNKAAMLVIEFITYSQPRSPSELSNVLETLILKTAEVIERHAGNDVAQSVCQRILHQLSTRPAPHKMN